MSSNNDSKRSSNLYEDVDCPAVDISDASICLIISSSPTVSTRYFKKHLTANNALYVCHADTML